VKNKFLILLTVAFLFAPIKAEAFDFGQWLKGIADNYSSMSEDSFMSAFLEWYEALKKYLNGDFQLSDLQTGSYGMPEFKQLEGEITTIYNEEGRTGESQTAARDATRVILDEHPDSLTEEGQEALKEREEAVTESVEASESAREAAENSTVTQDVLKQIATQNTEGAKLQGQNNLALNELGIKQDIGNEHLSNISEGVDQQIQHQTTQEDMSSGSFLGTASQLSLF
jgi:hypothetical protein